MVMNKIIVFTEYYYPGYKAGGPIQSVFNFARALSSQFEIYIICRDRDSGDVSSYKDINVNSWNDVRDHKVFYASPENCNKNYIVTLINQINPRLIYLNSFFSRFSSIVFQATVFKQLNYSILLAPRGEFNPAALKIKRLKKALYLYLIKFLLVRLKIHWHATSFEELNCIKRIISSEAEVTLIPSLGNAQQPEFRVVEKKPSEIRIITVARIHKIKNLEFFLEILKEKASDAKVTWDIYGFITDKAYLTELLKKSKGIQNLCLNIKGSVTNTELLEKMTEYHLFVLPTLGENFGHAIYDALIAGIPVLISDRTPWVNLDKNGVGADIPLDNKKLWNLHLNTYIEMGFETFADKRATVYQFGKALIEKDGNIQKYKELILQILK